MTHKSRVLVPSTSPDCTDIRSSIRIFGTPALVCSSNYPEKPDIRQIDATYATGAATPIEYRGRGHAKALISAMIKNKMELYAKEDHLTFMYSSADELYSSWFTVTPGVIYKIPLDHELFDPSFRLSTPEIEPATIEAAETVITADNLSTLLRFEHQALKFDLVTRMSEAPEAGEPTRLCTLLPTEGSIRHRFEDCRFAMNCIGLGTNATPSLAVQGIALFDIDRPIEEVKKEDIAFVLWTAGSKLRILSLDLIRASTPDQLLRLLRSAQKTALAWGLTEGIYWGGDRTFDPLFHSLKIDGQHEIIRGTPMFWLRSSKSDAEVGSGTNVQDGVLDTLEPGPVTEWVNPQRFSGAPIFFSPQ